MRLAQEGLNMTEQPWKRLADTLETRQALRWAFIEWKLEGQRLRSLAPLDFQEALEEFAEDRPQAYRGIPHARSA